MIDILTGVRLDQLAGGVLRLSKPLRNPHLVIVFPLPHFQIHIIDTCASKGLVLLHVLILVKHVIGIGCRE